MICCRVAFVTQLGAIDLNSSRDRMKLANFPVISTSRSLNQAVSSRGAAFVMTAIKYKNLALNFILQFGVSGEGLEAASTQGTWTPSPVDVAVRRHFLHQETNFPISVAMLRCGLSNIWLLKQLKTC